MQDPGEGAGWERLFWLVFKQTSNPIVLLDERRRIVDVNDAALTLFDTERAEVLGTSMADYIRPDERDIAASEWEQFLTSGEYNGKRALARVDGSEVQTEFAARLERIGGRRLATYVAMVDGEGVPSESPILNRELPLTHREREVVTLIALGRETPEIARELHISPETVRTHVRNAMSKLGARTRAQLVALVLCSEHAVQVPSLDE
jgi:PAS domain S-box-containing protein